MQSKFSPFPLSLFLFGGWFWVCILCCSPLCAQVAEFTLSGTVTDSSTGEMLVNAAIFEPESGKGALSNEYGFFSLTLPTGAHTFKCTYVGFSPKEFEIDLNGDRVLNIALPVNGVGIDTVLITAGSSPGTLDEMASHSVIYADEVRTMPIAFGEADVMRAVLFFPGVHGGNEGNTGFHYQGGSVDQNLVLIDEAPVYHSAHMLGILSVINPDVFHRGVLFSDYMPAQFGGRLSSVTDLRLKEGSNKRFGMAGGLGTLSSRLMIEGPIVKEKGSFLLAGRRTYADLLLPLAPDSALRNNELFFYDINAKANYKFGQNDHVYLSGYFGKDRFKTGEYSLGWGNSTGSARWNHIYSPKVFSNTTFIYSRYSYQAIQENGLQTFSWDAKIQDIALKLDYDFFPSDGLDISTGVHSTYHQLNPGISTGVGDSSIVNRSALPTKYSLESGVYADLKKRINKHWKISGGLRLSTFQNIGPDTVYGLDANYEVVDTQYYAPGELYQSFWNPEPRFKVAYQPHPSHGLFFSYQRTAQYIHLATLTPTNTPLDVWLPSSEQVQPQTADQVQLQYSWEAENHAYQIETKGFYKQMRNTIDFKDHANLVLNPYLEGELRFGKGRAYGWEAYAKKLHGPFQGIVSYTWSRSQRQIAEINEGKWYFAPFDKTHVLNLATTYELNKRITFAANWTYSTGTPATLPTGQMVFQGLVVPVYSGRNEARLPSYHRLDLAMMLNSKPNDQKRFEWDLNFSIYNVYNRHNTFAINFVENGGQLIAQRTYLYPILPSVTWNFTY